MPDQPSLLDTLMNNVKANWGSIKEFHQAAGENTLAALKGLFETSDQARELEKARVAHEEWAKGDAAHRAGQIAEQFTGVPVRQIGEDVGKMELAKGLGHAAPSIVANALGSKLAGMKGKAPVITEIAAKTPMPILDSRISGLPPTEHIRPTFPEPKLAYGETLQKLFSPEALEKAKQTTTAPPPNLPGPIESKPISLELKDYNTLPKPRIGSFSGTTAIPPALGRESGRLMGELIDPVTEAPVKKAWQTGLERYPRLMGHVRELGIDSPDGYPGMIRGGAQNSIANIKSSQMFDMLPEDNRTSKLFLTNRDPNTTPTDSRKVLFHELLHTKDQLNLGKSHSGLYEAAGTGPNGYETNPFERRARAAANTAFEKVRDPEGTKQDRLMERIKRQDDGLDTTPQQRLNRLMDAFSGDYSKNPLNIDKPSLLPPEGSTGKLNFEELAQTKKVAPEPAARMLADLLNKPLPPLNEVDASRLAMLQTRHGGVPSSPTKLYTDMRELFNRTERRLPQDPAVKAAFQSRAKLAGRSPSAYTRTAAPPIKEKITPEGVKTKSNETRLVKMLGMLDLPKTSAAPKSFKIMTSGELAGLVEGPRKAAAKGIITQEEAIKRISQGHKKIEDYLAQLKQFDIDAYNKMIQNKVFKGK